MKKNLIILVVIIFVGLLLTYFNFSSSFNKIEKNKIIEKEVEQKYIDLASYFNYMYFPVIGVENIIDGSLDSTFFKDGILILLSNSGCNPCQVNELKNLKDIHNKYNDRLKIMALYVSYCEKIEAIRLKKISTFNLPIYCHNGDKISDRFLTKPFPKVFYIKDQKIISTLIPITNNNSFSENFYRGIDNYFKEK
ncbi:MAG: hypothetical protein PHY57_05645 [Ignavibacterium sp.]|jgi:hypothetical protein|nr:MAG: hypothetical protein F9K42_01890 [Ignavibacterium sp.]MCZ7610343.1 hypothetical protein [Ignavibacterium sp.]MDD5607975.1 hypothetical protein [Ignavibacterium sp.]MDX9713777.1 hypothetical protein [Ignavibacteriaceae bacterium]GIK23462.1 MAG: hypothetical protein BroJett005_28760 [Ignavibacteriota bacterium]